jgi:hypothetical protein
VHLEALVKIGSDTYITLPRDGKTLEQIYILHPFALKRCSVLPDRGGKKVACHPKLWASRAKVGGAEGNRTLDLLNAIQALSQLSYGPTDGRTEK